MYSKRYMIKKTNREKLQKCSEINDSSLKKWTNNKLKYISPESDKTELEPGSSGSTNYKNDISFSIFENATVSSKFNAIKLLFWCFHYVCLRKQLNERKIHCNRKWTSLPSRKLKLLYIFITIKCFQLNIY